MNSRVTAKDRNAIKGALRRAFARSDLHKSVLARVTVEHSDPRNPKCNYWGYCEVCGVVQPRWKLAVDHVSPVIPVTTTFEEMGTDATVDRLWCDPTNLQAICPDCHDAKTAIEKAQKKELKAAAKKALR